MKVKSWDHLLPISDKNSDIFFKQTKAKSQKTSEFKLTKLVDTFLSNPPLDLEKEKYTIAVTNFEVYNSVFKIPEHDSTFRIITPGYCQDLDTT